MQSVLPYIRSHHGNMELSRIDGDVVYLAPRGQLRRLRRLGLDAQAGRRTRHSGTRAGDSGSARRGKPARAERLAGNLAPGRRTGVSDVNNGGDNQALLQRMLRKRPPPGERCDFCSAPLAPEHSHLIELAARRILCSCRPCYIVFEPEGAAVGRYRPIPERYLELADFALEDATWDALAIPIGLAFLFYNSLEKKMVAFYPSPVGATESLLPLDTWGEIAAANPVLSTLSPDVEAILIQRSARAAALLHRADRRRLRAGRHDPEHVEGLRRRRGGAPPHRRVLRQGRGTGARQRDART